MDDLIEKKVLATPLQAAIIYESGGLNHALALIEKLQKDFPQLPGMMLAYQTLRSAAAEKSADLGTMALRAAAKGGIDINASPSIHTITENDGSVFFVSNWKGRDAKKGGA